MMIEQPKSSGCCIKSALEQQRAKNAVPAERSMQQNPVQRVKETPAYIVELQERYQSAFKSEGVSLTEDTAEDALERFRQKFLESLEKSQASAPEQLDTSKLQMTLSPADYCSKFLIIRSAVDGGLCTDAQREAVYANWEKYYNVEKNIAEGGKETFLEYNLMFAGTAAYANDEMADMWAKDFIEEGKYTQEEYDKVQNFADALQEQSGVFVSAEFQYDDASGDNVRYSYMNALCAIGVDQLSFMADHREADEIWTKLAQGAYQDDDALVQALRAAGHDEIAAEQEEQHKSRFDTEDGALWDATVGYQKSPFAMPFINEEAFKNLKNEYFGSEAVKVTYTAEQLNKAYEQGKTEMKVLHTHPRLDIVSKDEESPEDRLKKQIESLKKKMKELQEEIKDIQGMELAEEKKHTMVDSFQKQIETIQVQINDALNQLADLAK